MTFTISRIIPRLLMANVGFIGAMSVSGSAYAVPSCEDQGLSYYEKQVNMTTDWQSYLVANLQPNKTVNKVAENFGVVKCASYLNAAQNPKPFLRQFDVVQKACSFIKPNPVIVGTSVDYGGAANNPGIIHQSGCRKVLKLQKMKRVAPSSAVLVGPG